MNILITGGAGFIGSSIIPELKSSGHKLFVIDNLSFGKRELASVSDSFFAKVDIRDKGKIELIFEEFKPDWLLHLAAIHFIPYCNRNPIETIEVNTKATLNLLNIAKKYKKLKGVLLASTAAVYPIHNTFINESLPPDPVDIYGISKLICEHLLHEFYLETSINSIVCRFFNAFGPNETNPHLIPEILSQIKNGNRVIKLGNLEPKRDFIHTFDMSRAVRGLIEKPGEGYEIFNLGRGIEYSVSEVVKAFEKAIKSPITIEQDASRKRKTDRLHLLADITKLKKYLNWEPKESLESGITQMTNHLGECF